MSVRLAQRSDTDRAIEQIRGATRIFIDTEFHAERHYLPRLFLVQVNVPNGDLWLFDPTVSGLLADLAEALVAVPWVVHGGGQDIRILSEWLGGVPDEVLDTQVGAGLLQPRFPVNLGGLLSMYLGRDLEKGATLSDWSRRPLSQEQLQYAAEDVALLPDLWGAIESRLIDADRIDVARQASAHLREEALNSPNPEEAWRRVPGSANLSPPQAAVLQELASWRERHARERRTPARTIVSDSILRELAKRQPITVDSLKTNRRFPKSIAKNLGQTLIDLIQTGQRRPEWGLPDMIARGSAEERALSYLSTFMELVGRDKQFAPRLVAPASLLQQLVIHRPQTREGLAEALGPWRDGLTGDDLWAALTGQVGMALGDTDIVARP